MHDGPEISENGKLSELSRLEEHLAWQSLKYVEPGSNLAVDQFLAPDKLTRLDAEESYVRGLLSSSKEQQQKWFTQAITLDPHFSSPAFELGKLALQRKDYRKAMEWFAHVEAKDPRYAETRFDMGLSAYGAGDYQSAVALFREVAQMLPMNEVYNNLGAAEDRLDQPVAIDDFRRAADADEHDPTYLFNLGLALLKNNYFEEATKRFEGVLELAPEDGEARSLLDRARRREFNATGSKNIAPERLKLNFDETAFRQLKAMLQPKGNP
jgi:tetratricopeptide (TPR) repeat protein